MQQGAYFRIRLDSVPAVIGRGIGQRENYRYEYEGHELCVIEICCVSRGVLHHKSGGETRIYPENSVALVHWEKPITAWSESPLYAESYVVLRLAAPPEPMTEEEVLRRDPADGDAVIPSVVLDEKTVRILSALVGRLIRRTRDHGDPAQTLNIRSAVLDILARLTEYSVDLARSHGSAADDKSFRLCRQACVYVAEHLNERISVEALAAHLEISTRYLSKLFSRHLGVSPVKYINREKIAAVAELLVARGMTLEAAGRSVGFEDVRYLRSLFRSVTGMTATEYKKTHGKNG